MPYQDLIHNIYYMSYVISAPMQRPPFHQRPVVVDGTRPGALPVLIKLRDLFPSPPPQTFLFPCPTLHTQEARKLGLEKREIGRYCRTRSHPTPAFPFSQQPGSVPQLVLGRGAEEALSQMCQWNLKQSWLEFRQAKGAGPAQDIAEGQQRRLA